MIRALLFSLLFTLPSLAEDDRPIVEDRGREDRARRDIPTLWIAGDSTVKSHGEMRGWGQEIGAWFDPEEINVVNRAIGGRSSRTFYNEGRWDEILREIQEGDFVIIQFGHNDVGPLGERGKFRGSVKGTGDETEEVEKPDGSVETVHSFGWYLRHYGRTASDKGATVIFCSPVPHKQFDRNGDFIPDWDKWRDWVEECAKDVDAHYIDLAEEIGKKYDRLGPDKVEELFADKRTHTSVEGAKLNAEILAAELKRLKGKPLDDYFAARKPD